MLAHNRVVFHQLEFVCHVFRILSLDIVVTSPSFRHQPDQDGLSLRHASFQVLSNAPLNTFRLTDNEAFLCQSGYHQHTNAFGGSARRPNCVNRNLFSCKYRAIKYFPPFTELWIIL